MGKFINDKLSTLVAYVPGEQPQDKKYIKLNTNESPYPPSPKVTCAKNIAETLNLYSDPTAHLLKSALADTYGVTENNVFVSNGSDEILNFLFMGFFDKSGAIFPDISYGFYKVFAELYGIKYCQKPLKDDFSIDIEDYKKGKENVVIANPNAPTGMTLSVDEIEKIVSCDPSRLVVIDEAYVDFGGESCIPLTKKYDNLIVVQTYSKSRSLAGGRLGFAVANASVIADLEKIKYSTNPYNVNSLTQYYGRLSLSDGDYYRNNCQKIAADRDFTTTELRKLGFTVLDSKANFVFAKYGAISGEELYKKLKEKGILVRHFDSARIRDYLRITIGTTAEMEALLAALKQIIKED